MKTLKANRSRSRFTIAGLACLCSSLSGSMVAGTLDIANNALEIATGVEPNVMFLTDDSGSMDFGVMTDEFQGEFFFSTSAFGFNYDNTHPDPGATGNAPATNLSGFTVPTPEALADLGVAAPQGGAWRAWNHNYSTIYYNPNVKYVPWKGEDVNGDEYEDVPATAAPYNPYRPADGTLDLTTRISYNSDCDALECLNGGAAIAVTVNNFYPARYYTWTDTDDDGEVDDDDENTLVEITDADELQNFANWFSYYRKRDLASKAAISNAMEPVSSIRAGVTTINNNAGNRLEVEDLNISASEGAKKDFFDTVFEAIPSGGTPLRSGLEDVGNYFACDPNTVSGITASTPPGSAGCPVEASPAGQCQQNFTILMTDGFWNGTPPTVGDADSDGAGGASQGPFDGASFADGIGARAGDDGGTLADVAMHYYERDLHSTLGDLVPTTSKDEERYTGATDPFEEMHQHMGTYTVGFGVEGTISVDPDPASAFTWSDPFNDGDSAKIDDLRHAAWNGRGDFLQADDPESLATSIQLIIDEIGSGTGSASSVAFNTQNLESGALVFRAFFNTEENTGNLIAQSVDITGDINTSTNLWEAVEQLDTIIDSDAVSRVIATYDAVNNTGIPFQWASLNATQQNDLNLPAVTDGNIATAPDPLGEDRLEYLRGDDDNEGSNYTSGEFRRRPEITSSGEILTGGKLGDFIHSSPVFAGTPPFQNRDNLPFPDTTGNLYSEFASTYRDRQEIVYIGANDGMLHAFNANTGSEVFAYVPNSLFPELSKLTDPDYIHRYYVDLSPSINDVYIRTTTGTNAGTDAWNTVLVGGMGAGMPGYFALNITDPNRLLTESNVASNVLWEFTQADDVGASPDVNDENLGVPITSPLIALSNIKDASENNRPVVIFGNGYNSNSSEGDAELYIAFIDGGLDGTWTRGTDFFKLNTGNGKAESSDGTTPNSLGGIRGIDTDQNGTVDVVYAGDYQGNLYRFNLNGTSIADIQSAASNPVQKVFTATYNSDTGPIQPITSRPVVIQHPTEAGFIVLIGTGSFFTNDDITAPKSEEIQSIYGIWDDFSDPSDSVVTVDYSKLQEQSFTNVATTVNGFTVRTLTDNQITRWGTRNNQFQGWVIDLDVPDSGGGIEFPGEKAVRNILIRGEFAFVNTVIPKSNTACTTGPGGFELAFNPENGGSGSTPIFDVNNDGSFDADDNVGGIDAAENIVTGLRFDKSTPTDSSFIGNRKVTQTSDRDIRSTGTNTGGDQALGRHSWYQIEID